jgi:UDP-N-acetylglucosamine 2-epimerase (hydrolysing)
MMFSVHRRRIMFLTGTRADFGKLKPLMARLQADPEFDVHVFVTGMHMLSKYGYTCEEIDHAGFHQVHRYINQNASDSMDHVLAKTITGLSDYVREMTPALIVVHGDRVEALAGATVGAFNNVLVGHIEGGEVSGTVDELIRHAVSKLSHVHFAANDLAGQRLIQLGERSDSVHVIGSPDIDVMNSDLLPDIAEVRRRYAIPFERYCVLAFHPVISEIADMRRQSQLLVDQVIASGRNYVVIYPNNDYGCDHILEAYEGLQGLPRFRVFPSMRFEYFLTTLKHADFIIGNSSAGVREAPHFGVPTLNLGSRQNKRVVCPTVLNVPMEADDIAQALVHIEQLPREVAALFGDGGSARRFHDILRSDAFWETPTQKYFIDRQVN